MSHDRYDLHMTDAHPVPEMGHTVDSWLAARAETNQHITSQVGGITKAWIQQLANLLEVERLWQEQYNEFLKDNAGHFPNPTL